jgi:hypothetical protein
VFAEVIGTLARPPPPVKRKCLFPRKLHDLRTLQGVVVVEGKE